MPSVVVYRFASGTTDTEIDTFLADPSPPEIQEKRIAGTEKLGEVFAEKFSKLNPIRALNETFEELRGDTSAVWAISFEYSFEENSKEYNRRAKMNFEDFNSGKYGQTGYVGFSYVHRPVTGANEMRYVGLLPSVDKYNSATKRFRMNITFNDRRVDLLAVGYLDALSEDISTYFDVAAIATTVAAVRIEAAEAMEVVDENGRTLTVASGEKVELAAGSDLRLPPWTNMIKDPDGTPIPVTLVSRGQRIESIASGQNDRKYGLGALVFRRCI